MIEKIRAVSNPLTIIAIFAALAEIAGTIMLGLVDATIQSIFVWFVMIFPILIVVLFFATLNFNAKVLYAPSDFKDEDNFLQTVLGAKWISSNLETIELKVEEAKAAISQEMQNHLNTTEGVNDASIKALIREHLQGISNTVETARETAEDLKLISFEKLPNSALQARIMHTLKNRGGFVPVSDIADVLGVTPEATRRALEKLTNRGIAEPNENSSAFKLAIL